MLNGKSRVKVFAVESDAQVKLFDSCPLTTLKSHVVDSTVVELGNVSIILGSSEATNGLSII